MLVFFCPVSRETMAPLLLQAPLAGRYRAAFADQASAAALRENPPPQAQLWQAIGHLEAGVPALLHVQEEEGFVQGAADAAAAEALTLRQLARWRKLGGRILWRAQQAGPQACAAPAIRRWLAAEADAILTSGRASAQMAAELDGADPARLQPLPEAALDTAAIAEAEALAAAYDRLAAAMPPLHGAQLPKGLRAVASPRDRAMRHGAPLVCDWPRQKAVARNWGDKLNRPLVRLLSGRPALHVDHRPVATPGPAGHRGAEAVFKVIGSGIRSGGRNHVIWGSGFISAGDPIPALRAIHAVRGPLTRAKLLAAGRDCPAVYGDPALLMPMFYRPAIAVEHDLGIIQHFREAGVEPLPRIPAGLRVKIIDITGGITEVLDAILSCRAIVSSSLHGLIAAHAYGVPASWIKFSDRPLGDDFKFRDYWASVGWPAARAIAVDGDTEALSLMGEMRQAIPVVDVARLLEACPFVHAERRAALRARAAETLPAIPPVRFLARA